MPECHLLYSVLPPTPGFEKGIKFYLGKSLTKKV